MACSICKTCAGVDCRRRLLQTFFILFAYVAMSFIVAQRGAAFLDIQLITNTDLESASFFFTASGLGGVVGALLFGALYDRFNRDLLLYLSVLGMSATVSFIPYCIIYEGMLAAWFFNHIFIGGYDVCANAEVVRMWGLRSQPYLFLVNVGHSFGSFLSPLLTEPFLVPKEQVARLLAYDTFECNASVDESEMFDVTLSNHSFPPLNNTICGSRTRPNVDIRLSYAYTISALIAFVASLPLLYQTCRKRNKSTRQKSKSSNVEAVNELPLCHYVIAIFIVIVSYVCVSGIEDGFYSYMMTFAVKQLNWSKSHGAQLSAAFFGTYTLVRILGIFFTDMASPTLVLLCSHAALIISVLGVVFCSIQSVNIGVWISFCFCGFVSGIFFPITIVWINKTILSISGRVSSFVLVGVAIGKLCNPILLGYLMTEESPIWFCYILLIYSGVSIFVILISSLYSRKILAGFRRVETDIEIPIENNDLQGPGIKQAQGGIAT